MSLDLVGGWVGGWFTCLSSSSPLLVGGWGGVPVVFFSLAVEGGRGDDPGCGVGLGDGYCFVLAEFLWEGVGGWVSEWVEEKKAV